MHGHRNLKLAVSSKRQAGCAPDPDWMSCSSELSPEPTGIRTNAPTSLVLNLSAVAVMAAGTVLLFYRNHFIEEYLPHVY